MASGDFSQKALVQAASNSVGQSEDAKPFWPPDLLNLNNSDMVELFEPGQQNSGLLESYYQVIQDSVTPDSSTGLQNESLEALMNDLEELSQPDLADPLGKVSNTVNIFFPAALSDHCPEKGVSFSPPAQPPIAEMLEVKNGRSDGLKDGWNDLEELSMPDLADPLGKVSNTVNIFLPAAMSDHCPEKGVSFSPPAQPPVAEMLEVKNGRSDGLKDGWNDLEELSKPDLADPLGKVSITVDIFLPSALSDHPEKGALVSPLAQPLDEEMLEVKNGRSDRLEGPLQDHKSYKCSICSLKFVVFTNFRRHLSSHTQEKVFCCDPCDLVLVSDAELLAHNVKVHHYSNGYLCNICNATIATHPELLEHIGGHSNEEAFTCGECETKFKKYSDFCIHSYQYTGEPSHKCSVCSSFFRSERDLLSHQSLLHLPCVEKKLEETTNNGEFQCEHCGKLFEKFRALTSHRHRWCAISEEMCKTCGKSFRRAKDLHSHVVSAHTLKTSDKTCRKAATFKKSKKRTTFDCAQCGKQFHTVAVFSRHVSTHQKKTRQSSVKARFKIKVSSSSFESMKFACEMCCMPFRRAFDLKKHVDLFHAPEMETVHPKNGLIRHSSSVDSSSSMSSKKRQRGHLLDGLKVDSRKSCKVLPQNEATWINVNNSNMLIEVKGTYHDDQAEVIRKAFCQKIYRKIENPEGSLEYCCPQCSLSFKTIFQMIKHKQLHPLPFCCPDCGVSFLIEVDFIKHICVGLV